MRILLLLAFLTLFPSALPAEEAAAPQPPPEGLAGHSLTGAAEGPDAGARYMREGEESFQNGDYDHALDFFTRALPLLSGKELARAHEQLAYIYAAFGKADRVYSEFVESLKLDPALELDPNATSPKIYESFLKARNDTVREGVLVCNCDPSGAEVYLDGALLGEAPLKKEHIPEGEHLLTLRKLGYEDSAGKVMIKKNVTLTVEDKMAEARGELFIATEPPGVKVAFDGRDAGAAPLTVKKVSGGRHKVSLRLDYFEGREFTYEFKTGEKKELRAQLRRRLLLIKAGETEGRLKQAQDAVSAALAETLSSLQLVVVDRAGLRGALSERGMDPSGADFLSRAKGRIELEDSAVLSNLLERDGCELALAVITSDENGRLGLTFRLYSISSGSVDTAAYLADDMEGLLKKAGEFAGRWLSQEKDGAVSIGARIADREGGGAYVISVLPLYPASEAGIRPGDVITAIDGTPAGGRAGVAGALRQGIRQRLSLLSPGGGSRDVELTPVAARVEPPIESGDYLYNLALARYSGAESADDPYALLGLGNMRAHFGSYDKAVKAYRKVETPGRSGICAGTALFRLGQAYERQGLWTEAASSYRKALFLYPDATVEGPDGPYAAPLARQRLKELYQLGLVKERWWL